MSLRSGNCIGKSPNFTQSSVIPLANATCMKKDGILDLFSPFILLMLHLFEEHDRDECLLCFLTLSVPPSLSLSLWRKVPQDVCNTITKKSQNFRFSLDISHNISHFTYLLTYFHGFRKKSQSFAKKKKKN